MTVLLDSIQVGLRNRTQQVTFFDIGSRFRIEGFNAGHQCLVLAKSTQRWNSPQSSRERSFSNRHIMRS